MDSKSFILGAVLGGAIMAVSMAGLAWMLLPARRDEHGKPGGPGPRARTPSYSSDKSLSGTRSISRPAGSISERGSGRGSPHFDQALIPASQARHRAVGRPQYIPEQNTTGSYDEKNFQLGSDVGLDGASSSGRGDSSQLPDRVETQDTHVSVHLPGRHVPGCPAAPGSRAGSAGQPGPRLLEDAARSSSQSGASSAGAAGSSMPASPLLRHQADSGALTVQASASPPALSDSDEDADLPPTPVRVIVDRTIEEDYELLDVLGRGTFSVVRKCAHRPTGELRAVKCIDAKRFKLSPTFKQARLLEEVQILATLRHPCIIKLYDVYWDRHSDAVYLVTELAPGGELFDSIITAGNFSEAQARHVMWQALSAVHHLHKRGIIHRDLKPENILVFNEPSSAMDAGGVAPKLRIKLADFGTSRYLGPQAHATSFVGSPQYVAPEVLFARDHATSYDNECDIWSLGCIAYVMLAGYLPFDDAASGDDGLTWEQRIKAGRFAFAPPVWTHISDTAKDLIRKMLTVAPDARPDARAAMAHPWFHAERGPASTPLTQLPSPAPAPAQVEGYAGSEAQSLAMVLKRAAGESSPTSRRQAGSPSTSAPRVPPPGLSDMVAAVESAMNLQALRKLQESASATFQNVYQRAEAVPSAAAAIRSHAVACRDLQLRVVAVIQKFRAGAVAMREVLVDIEVAVGAGDTAVVPPLFEQLRSWITEMRSAALAVQDSYSTLVAGVQQLIERATRIQSVAQIMDHEPTSPSASTPSTPSTAPSSFGPSSTSLGLLHPRAMSLSAAGSDASFDAMFDAPAVVGNPEVLAAWTSSRRGTSSGSNASNAAAKPRNSPSLSPLVGNTELTSQQLGPYRGGQAGGSGSVPSIVQLTPAESELLMTVLSQLKSVDALLLRVVGFWSSMELVIDVVVQRKEHTATVLEHATTAAMQGRALQRLSGYKQFWRAMEWLCDGYLEWARTTPVYKFLNGPSPRH